MTPPDPYRTLGITPSASDEELRTAYRRLVQLHHPDHNNGSHESALRFAEVQEAYAHVKLMRRQATAGTGTTGTRESPPSGDPALDARLKAMENELRSAREQREKAAQAAQQAARAAAQEAARATAAQEAKKATRYDEQGRATDENLGYYSTDDSFAKILDDFADQVSTRFSEAHPPAQAGDGATKRRPRSVADWIDELGSRLTGDQHRKKDE